MARPVALGGWRCPRSVDCGSSSVCGLLGTTPCVLAVLCLVVLLFIICPLPQVPRPMPSRTWRDDPSFPFKCTRLHLHIRVWPHGVEFL